MSNIRNIDLNLLVAFDALYDTQSVTQAADRLSLTQPTVSGMLARLRRLFGDPLFVRTQHGVLPTPRAEALAEPVKALLLNAEALVAPVQFDPAKAEMTVAVSANDYLQQALIVPFLGALRRKAPGIRVAVMPAYISDLTERLSRGQVDLAVTIPAFADTSLRRTLLFTERYVCIARRAHPLKKGRLSLDDFCRFPHVIVSPTGGSFSGPTDEALEERGIRREVCLSVPSFHLMLEAVRSDDLLALIPERFLRGKSAGLKLFEPPVPVPDFDVIACWHQRQDHDPAQHWLRDQLIAAAKRTAGDA